MTGVETVGPRFYMDDYLDSHKTETEAIDQNSLLKKILEKGGIHLGKWVSNQKNVQVAMGGVEMDVEMTPMDGKVLGIVWRPTQDTLSFAVRQGESSRVVFTQRSLLSQLAGIYDPMGLASPFTVRGKIMMQRLAKLEKGWDDELDDQDRGLH
eukprot:snap_masked-scaffold2335_size16968-processed-gene-0.0 protein:Tk06478 transcript:snap_masked-scaffold2335_size16968-processed-gene-0.0-mRNA-1 annotation:"PREDICTED: uncharacterized protein LOC100893771"